MVRTAAMAQDVPKAEWLLGYNYVPINLTTEVPAYSANGRSSQVAIDFSRCVSGVVDLGGYHKGVIDGYNIDNIVSDTQGTSTLLLEVSREHRRYLFYNSICGTEARCPQERNVRGQR